MPLLTFLLGFLGPVGDFIVKLMKARGPPQEVIEAEKAGSATQALRDETAHDTEVQKAADAGSSVGGAVASDDGLRKFEQTDPNNRDSVH